MSIGLLQELEQETRRLFVAGSKLASGDLRLGKLLPQLRKLGEAAPVFARVAQAVEQATEAGEDNPSVKLLELSTLLSSILYTQGMTESKGEALPLEGGENFRQTSSTYRRLSPVLEALSQKGQGRLEVIRQARQDGLFDDYRLLIPAVAALDESYPEISDFLESEVVPLYGRDALPVLRRQFRMDGGKGDARRLQLIHRQLGSSGMELYLEAAEAGSQEIRTTAIGLLGHYPEQESFLLGQAGERRKEIRRAALSALATIGTPRAADRLFEALASPKDGELAVEPIANSRDEELILRVVSFARSAFDKLRESGESEETLGKLQTSLDALRSRDAEGMSELVRDILSEKSFTGLAASRIQESAARLLIGLSDPEARAFAVGLKDTHNHRFLDYSLRAAIWSLSPEEVYLRYSGYLTGTHESAGKLLLQAFLQLLPSLYEKMTEDGSRIAASLDPRWVQAFIRLDEAELVCRAAESPDRHTVNYLIGKCRRIVGIGNDYDIHCFLALFHIGYPDASEVLMDALTSGAGRQMYYLYGLQEFLLLQLSASSADRLVRLAENEVPYESTRKKLIEIAEAIRTKPQDEQGEFGDKKGWSKWISKMF
ncbi:HEAT repeat domain-containing protein [Cohnella suwonensis]|uniref:HEAT repeat domain-containing protein n=1 Tax=Cohnella suwonensis TaxID=696072 RepID=A0ABW0LSY9_9BACL